MVEFFLLTKKLQRPRLQLRGRVLAYHPQGPGFVLSITTINSNTKTMQQHAKP